MAEIHPTEAAAVLVDHFGPQLAGDRDEGRRRMAEILHTHFGIAIRDARRFVEALERAGTIRWVEQRLDTEARASASGSIPVISAVHAEGYWQLEPA